MIGFNLILEAHRLKFHCPVADHRLVYLCPVADAWFQSHFESTPTGVSLEFHCPVALDWFQSHLEGSFLGTCGWALILFEIFAGDAASGTDNVFALKQSYNNDSSATVLVPRTSIDVSISCCR